MTKIIELKGLQFENKGSELMLYSILDKVRNSLENVAFTMGPDLKNRPYKKIVKKDIYPKAWFQKYGFQIGYVLNKFPQKVTELFGFIKDSQVDIVFDGSGFTYGDQWPEKNIIQMARYIKKWKKQGTKVVLLPQAFGPFNNKKIKPYLNSIVKYADKIYPRDKVSYNYITEVVGQKNNIRIYPDFTVLTPGILPNKMKTTQLNAAIIPNSNMIRKTNENKKNNYVPFLVSFIKELKKLDYIPFLLIHAGKDDQKLATEIENKLREDIQIIKEDDPIKIKGIIGSCEIVFSSRYHGLINALSQGVPAIGTSWSHKYKELFNFYEYPEFLLSSQSDINKIKKVITLIGNKNVHIKNTLKKNARKHKESVNRMWKEIIDLIK
jgi:colanic acid/amylovoran biosynthesis protein